MKQMRWGLQSVYAAMVYCLVGSGAALGAAPEGITSDPAVNGLYIVQLMAPPLALYDGGLPGLSAPARDAKGRIDVKSVSAQRYLSELQQQQDAFLAQLERVSQQPVEVVFSYRHASNAMALSLSPTLAAAVEKMPGVRSVHPNLLAQLDGEPGPYWVQAPLLWRGGSANPDTIFDSGFQPPLGTGFGEGVVVGMIDSGINYRAEAFSAVSSFDGYRHVNPLGDGVYKGWCNPGFAVRDTCNAKVIGIWDFVDGQTPPGETEVLGGDDENGHGSHTAGIVAGNERINVDATSGVETRIRGVAPRANVISYDACYSRANSPVGLCPAVSTLAAINQAIADGVDVINYSISGSANPWTDPIEQAFLAATAAGIFVATSGGNSGATPGIVAHRSPWTTTVAASTAPELVAADLLRVDVPAGALRPVGMARVLGATPGLPSFDFQPLSGLLAYVPNTLGCNSAGGYPAGAFTGRIALLDLAPTSSCSFVEQVVNARNAGAIAAILLDDLRYPNVAISAPSPTQIPVSLLNLTDSALLRTVVTANPGLVRVSLGSTAPFSVYRDSFADVMGKFSSRGPSPFNDLKPDVTAPGVEILSADRNFQGDPNLNHRLSGTSMSAPHVAGVAALIRQRKPNWTPMQIKSAIVGSAQPAGILNYDDAPLREFPADTRDYGAGSVRAARANASTLAVAATAAAFSAANPATGGVVEALNLPNLTQQRCGLQCSFVRNVENLSATPQSVNAALLGLPGTITPASFVLAPAARVDVAFTIDASAVAGGTSAFGSVVLTPSTGTPLRLPVSISSPPPSLAVNPSSLRISLARGASAALALRISNDGGPSLQFASVSGLQEVPYLSQLPRLSTGAFISSSFFQVRNAGVYVADDFALVAAGALRRITVPTFSSNNLNTTLASVRVRVYADAAGSPASHPEATPEMALWACELPIGAPGLSVRSDLESSNTVRIELAQVIPSPACPTAPPLSEGRYWFSLYGVFSTGDGGNLLTRLNWHSAAANPDSGFGAQAISPNGFISALSNWTLVSTLGPNVSAAMAVELLGSTQCGAPWLALQPVSGTVPAFGQVEAVVQINALTELPLGLNRARLCLQSNDPLRRIVQVPVELTITPP